MVSLTSVVLAYLSVGGASGNLLGLPLDIPGLLTSLRPAPADDPRFTNFKPPGPHDVRSPCPALNALANHGFLNHDGRNMSIPHLVQGLSAGLNIGAEVTVALGGAALHTSPDPASGSFDLSDLIAIEHDASMSRQDAAFGSAQSFDSVSWQQYIGVFEGKTITDVPTASKAKYARYNDSLTHNPNFRYGVREAVLSYGENALYLQAMSDPVSGRAKLSYVRSLFEEERLPYNLGWRPSATPVTLASMGAMIVQLIASGPEPVPEAGRIVVDTYKTTLVTVAGGSKILATLTEGLSSVLGL